MKKNIQNLKLYLKDKYDLDEAKPYKIGKISDLYKPNKKTSYIFTKDYFIYQNVCNNCYSEAVIKYLDIKQLKEIRDYSLLNKSFKKRSILEMKTEKKTYEFEFENKRKIKKILNLIAKHYNKSMGKIKLLVNN